MHSVLCFVSFLLYFYLAYSCDFFTGMLSGTTVIIAPRGLWEITRKVMGESGRYQTNAQRNGARTVGTVLEMDCICGATV